jgi:hypothetical protein
LLQVVPQGAGLSQPGATDVGGRERRRPPSAASEAADGCERFLKLAEIPLQLAAAGESVRGFLGLRLLSVPRLFLLAGRFLLRALTLLWPPKALRGQRSGQ